MSNPLSGSGGEEQRAQGHDRLAEGVAIVAISSVIFDIWTAGWLAGDFVPDHLTRGISIFLITAILFGVYWAYKGWADTHNLNGNPFVDSFNYFTGRDN